MNSPALAQSKLDFVFDFPRTYLSALERIVYPDWYLACFLGDYRNSSVWGHYGDHHKGACLVFGAGGSQADPHLRLKQVVGSSSSRGKDGKIIERLNWDYQPLPFYKVKYTQEIGELDFFRSIGTIPVHDLLSIWYTDKAGNRTNCSDHVRSKDELSWRAKYWDRFYRDITIKSKDWEYEGETRLILLSSLINLNDVNLRKLKYEFRALKEIIFGLNMDDRDKAEILDIILKKCKETNRTDFKFYQAFYGHGTGQIAKTKIDVNFQGS